LASQETAGEGIPSASQQLGGYPPPLLDTSALVHYEMHPRATTNSKMCKLQVAAKAKI